MRRILLGWFCLALTTAFIGPVKAEPRRQLSVAATPVVMGAGIMGPAQGLADGCHRAWRCGPSECGWRAVCTWAGWRPNWRSHEPWRHHQWRRHYW